MSTVVSTLFLRRVLLADAFTCAAAGALMTLAGPALAPWLGLPRNLLLAAGLMLLPWSLLLYWLARRPALPAAAVGVVIVCNVVWAIDCVWVAFGRTYAPTPFGQAFVAAQALAVLALAELEWFGLRRARAGTAA